MIKIMMTEEEKALRAYAKTWLPQILINVFLDLSKQHAGTQPSTISWSILHAVMFILAELSDEADSETSNFIDAHGQR